MGFVDTKPLYMASSDSPDDAGFHFHNNARTFLNVGKSMGDEMILAINDMAFCDGFVSVPTENENAIVVYPNPTSGQLNMDLGDWNGSNTMVRLHDVHGKIVFEQQSFSGLSIDVSGYAKGVYLMEISSEGEAHRQRVVVE